MLALDLVYVDDWHAYLHVKEELAGAYVSFTSFTGTEVLACWYKSTNILTAEELARARQGIITENSYPPTRPHAFFTPLLPR